MVELYKAGKTITCVSICASSRPSAGVVFKCVTYSYVPRTYFQLKVVKGSISKYFIFF